MPDRVSDVTRIVQGGRARGLSDDQIRALVARYDERQQDTAPPAPMPRTRDQAVADATGFVRGRPEAPRELLQGGIAGLASTAAHGGDMIRRATGMERIINEPEVQAAMTPPASNAGKAGFYGEQMYEYVNPLRRTAGLMRGASLFKRTMADAGAAGAQAAAQSGGDPSATITAAGAGAILPFGKVVGGAVRDTVSRAAHGAKEGGLGGAIARAVRMAAPGEPRVLLTQALKPRSVKTGFPSALDRAIPELKAAEGAIGRPIQGVDDLLEATKAAKAQLQQQLGVLRGNTQGFQVDGTPIATAMVKAIPKKLQLENPEAALRMTAAANVYRRPFVLDEMEALLRETNAELDGLYAMYPQARGHALAANPGAASLDAQAKAMRDAVYSTLDAPGQGAAARELNRRYGALLEVEGEASRRLNVARRQQPESLSEQIGAVRAAADMARGTWRVLQGDLTGAADIAAAHAGRSTAKAIKESQTTDALIRRAFEGFTSRPPRAGAQAPAPVQMPPTREIRGLLPRGPLVTPPPADPSFVRGVPAMPSHAYRPALPAPARQMPPGADPSFVRALEARPIVVRDPRTGRMRRIYTSEPR